MIFFINTQQLLFLAYFEKMQDKLNQIREAREALDALRHDHAVRKQIEEQEAARMRQLQIMQKLEAMRQQKRVGFTCLHIVSLYNYQNVFPRN